MNVNLQISADMPDIQLSRRIIPQSGFQEFKKIGIGFVNGIMNSESAAIEHACRLSAFAEGNVQLIYNCSHFIFSDVGEYILEKLTGQHLLPSLLLHLQWEEFFKTHGEDAQFLQVCHSAGANHVKIALRNCPYKDRITVLAVAPASIITPQECRDAENIASQLDKVPLINDPAEKKYLKILPVHPEETSAILDHGFDSMTYEDYIIEFIKKFKAENEI